MTYIERSKAIEAVLDQCSIIGAMEGSSINSAINGAADALRDLPAANVSDEMVERARQAWLESASDYTRLDVSIRAAIVAALGG